MPRPKKIKATEPEVAPEQVELPPTPVEVPPAPVVTEQQKVSYGQNP